MEDEGRSMPPHPCSGSEAIALAVCWPPARWRISTATGGLANGPPLEGEGRGGGGCRGASAKAHPPLLTAVSGSHAARYTARPKACYRTPSGSQAAWMAAAADRRHRGREVMSEADAYGRSCIGSWTWPVADGARATWCEAPYIVTPTPHTLWV